MEVLPAHKLNMVLPKTQSLLIQEESKDTNKCDIIFIVNTSERGSITC